MPGPGLSDEVEIRVRQIEGSAIRRPLARCFEFDPVAALPGRGSPDPASDRHRTMKRTQPRRTLYAILNEESGGRWNIEAGVLVSGIVEERPSLDLEA
jgi:hypothetical protein